MIGEPSTMQDYLTFIVKVKMSYVQLIIKYTEINKHIGIRMLFIIDIVEFEEVTIVNVALEDNHAKNVYKVIVKIEIQMLPG